MNIEISKVGNNFEVTRMLNPSYVTIKNYDTHTNLRFQNNEINLANRLGSNQVLIAIRDDYPHIVAKDPLLTIKINYEKKVQTFTEKPQTINKPILLNQKEEKNIPIVEELIIKKIKEEPVKIQESVKKEEPIPLVIQEEKVVKEETSIILNPQQSIEDKIEKIRKILKHIIKSEIQHGFLLCGTSGIGKSFLVEEILEEEFNFRRDLNYIIYKGSMTEAGLFTVIRKNPNKILILDDCDSVWSSDNALNLLKGGLDSTVPKINKKKFIHEVKYTMYADDSLEEDTKEIYTIYIDDAHTEDECRNLFNKRIKTILSGDSNEKGKKEEVDISYEIVEINEIESEFIKPKRFVSKITTRKKQDFPIEFKGKILFISNWELEQFDVNLRNRIKMCSFSLNRQELVIYIKSLADKLMPQIKDMGVKNRVLDYYLQNPELPLDIRIFVNSVDLAVTSPNDWTTLLEI